MKLIFVQNTLILKKVNISNKVFTLALHSDLFFGTTVSYGGKIKYWIAVSLKELFEKYLKVLCLWAQGKQ